MIKHILNRRDTTTNWNQSNPILLNGEFGIEICSDETKKLKLGNGFKTWTELEYLIDDEKYSDILNSINEKDIEQDSRLEIIENNSIDCNNKVDELDEHNTTQDDDIQNLKTTTEQQEQIINYLSLNDVQQDEILNTLGSRVTQLENTPVSDAILESLEDKNIEQDDRIETIEDDIVIINTKITNIETKNVEQDIEIDAINTAAWNLTNRTTSLETNQGITNGRLQTIENKNTEQDNKITSLENIHIESNFALVNEKINEEIGIRENADTDLQSQISFSIGLINTEIQAREDKNIIIEGLINQEISDREDGDFNLQSQITQEISDREAGDSNLQSQINVLSSMVSIRGSVDTYEDLPDPTSLRIGDAYIVEIDSNKDNKTSLYSIIDTGSNVLGWDFIGEFTVDLSNYYTKTEVDTNIYTKTEIDLYIDDEVTDRETADSGLQSQINQEISNRTTADTSLQNNIDTVSSNLTQEISNRTNGDSGLQSQITQEISDREDDDSGLQSQIDSLDSNLQNKVDKNGTDRLITATEIEKLSGIATGAQVNVQSDWNQTEETSDDFINNKPSIPAIQVVAELPNEIVLDTLYFVVNGGSIDMVMNDTYFTMKTPPIYSILRIDTTLADTENAFQFPIKSEIPSALTVDWGDGVTETVDQGTETGPTHTYSVPGVYRIQFESLEKSEAMVKSLFYDDTDNIYKSMILSLNNFVGVLPYDIITVGGNFLEKAFYGCTSLVTAPAIPQSITTAGNYFLANTFYGCTSLVNAPELPQGITTAGANFLYCTFYGCISLVAAPEFPQGITYAGISFMANIFRGCTSLVTVPSIPKSVTTAVSYFLYAAFQSCTSLVTAPELPQNITTGGTFFLANTFTGCTSLVTAPAIPQGITNPQTGFLNNTFNGCTALTTLLPNDSSKMPWELYPSPETTNSFVKNCTNITSPVAYSAIPSLWK